MWDGSWGGGSTVSEDMSIESLDSSPGDGFVKSTSGSLSLLKSTEASLAWLEFSPEQERHFVRDPPVPSTPELWRTAVLVGERERGSLK